MGMSSGCFVVCKSTFPFYNRQIQVDFKNCVFFPIEAKRFLIFHSELFSKIIFSQVVLMKTALGFVNTTILLHFVAKCLDSQLFIWPLTWVRLCDYLLMTPSKQPETFPTCTQFDRRNSNGKFVWPKNFSIFVIYLFVLEILFITHMYALKISDGFIFVLFGKNIRGSI